MPSDSHRLCISILPESMPQLEAQIAACDQADLIEIRFDKLDQVDFKKIRKLTPKPLIATWRSTEEGGDYHKEAETLLPLYKKALKCGFDYIDVEYRNAERLYPKLKSHHEKIILSTHFSEKRTDSLDVLLLSMFNLPAAVYKLIFPVNSATDNARLFPLVRLAQEHTKPFIIHGMGPGSLPSRVAGAIKGNCWSYISLPGNKPVAEGQIDLALARQVYRLPHVHPATRVFGLVGSPLQQSSGWLLHNRLMARLEPDGKTDHLYLNFETESFPEFWEKWEPYLSGLSITRPHKETVLAFLNGASTEVKISGVCNTMIRTEKGWIGYNTDMLAIETLLRPYRSAVREGGLVVGTGATARSAIAALKRLEADPIYIVGRNEERGRLLADKFNIDYLQDDEIHYASAAVIIQTTPVGQAPHADQYPLGTSLFRRDRIVLDVVYNPAETRFLQIARDRNCTVISGAEMFIHQAARQAELFTGKVVSPEEVRACWSQPKS